MSAVARAARGFGLIEVMISASILLIGVAAVVTTVNHIEHQYQHQRYVTAAIHVGESTLEELLGRFPTDPELVAGPVHWGTDYSVHGVVVPGPGFFQTSWVVTAGVPIPQTRQVVVTVTWIEDGLVKKHQMRGVRS